MRWWWMVGVLAVAVAWIVGEVAAQAWLERRIAERVRDAASGQVEVEAAVEAFPVLTRLAVTGEVERVEVTAVEVAGRGLGRADVAVTVDNLGLDRSALVAGELDVTGVGGGRFRAAVDTSGVADPVRRGLEVVLGGAERLGIEVTRDGISVRLPLVGEVGVGLPVRAPCDPDVDLTSGELVLACSFTEVPDVLTQVAAPDRRLAPRRRRALLNPS